MIKIIDKLDMGIFPGHVLFSNGFDYDELVFELKGNWKDGLINDKELIDSGNWFGLRRDLEIIKTGEVKYLFYIIIKKGFKFKDDHYCKLAHEVLHICQFFLKNILDRNVEIEAEAYLHTHLMKQCLTILRKGRK